jgi:hypothetical protein
MGGAIFVHSGSSLTLSGLAHRPGNTIALGSGANGGGNGSAFGSGSTITFQARGGAR